jgi:hypothetical protein
LLREVVDRECVGGFRCASARASGINFQACSIDRSDISPFKINELRTVDQIIAYAGDFRDLPWIPFHSASLARTSLAGARELCQTS